MATKASEVMMKGLIGKGLANWRVKTVLPYVQGRLLDIGCGTNLLVRSNGSGIGVDIYQWGEVDMIVQNTAHLPFSDGYFDTVTIIAALNHIPNRIEVLQESHRLLGENGILIATMIPPNLSRLWHALRRHGDADQAKRGMAEGEVYGLSPKQVQALLVSAGFAIVLRRKFMLGVNQLTVARKG